MYRRTTTCGRNEDAAAVLEVNTQDKIQVRLIGGPMDLDDEVIECTYITIQKTVRADDGTLHNYLIEQDINDQWIGRYNP